MDSRHSHIQVDQRSDSVFSHSSDVHRHAQRCSRKSIGQLQRIQEICSAQRLDSSKFSISDQSPRRPSKIVEERLSPRKCQESETDVNQGSRFHLRRPRDNTSDAKHVDRGVSPRSQSWRFVPKEESLQILRPAFSCSLEGSQDECTHRSEEGPSRSSGKMAEGSQAHQGQVQLRIKERNRSDFAVQWNDPALSKTGRTIVPLQDIEVIGNNSADQSPYQPEGTDEVSRRRRFRVSFPTLNFGISFYDEGSTDSWLRKLGIHTADLGTHWYSLALGGRGGSAPGPCSSPSQVNKRGSQGVDTDRHSLEVSAYLPRAKIVLDLYTPMLIPVDLPAIVSLSTEEQVKILQWTCDESRYMNLLRNVPLQTRRLYDCATDFPIEQMLTAGIIRPAAQDEKWKSSVRVFGIDEPHKNRRRLILDSVLLNDMFDLDGNNMRTQFIKLKDLVVLAKEAKGNILVSDFKCFYYQIPLARSVQKYLAFRHTNAHGSSTVYFVRRLPMGFSGSVSIANTISQIIVAETFRKAEYSFQHYSGFTTAHNREGKQVRAVTQVDNIYFFGGDVELQRIFLEVIASLRVTASECKILSEGDVLGYHFKCRNDGASVNLPEKFITKHSPFLAAIIPKLPLWVFWRAMAVILRGLCVLQKPLCDFYGLMFDIRKVSIAIFKGEASWNEDIEMSFLAWVQFQETRQIILENAQVEARTKETDGHVIFSDASLEQGGIVIVGPDHCVSSIISFPDDLQHIGEKEAYALSAAVVKAKKLLIQSPVFVVDASSVFYSCIKGHSSNFRLNYTVSLVKHHFPTACFMLIESKANPADEPSRGKATIEEKTNSAVRRVESHINNLQRTREYLSTVRRQKFAKNRDHSDRSSFFLCLSRVTEMTVPSRLFIDL